MPTKRMSKERAVFKGSLKGVSCKSYQFIKKVQVKKVLFQARQYIDPSVWTKFDRAKPMSPRQAQELEAAINRVLRETTPDYPINIPYMKLESQPVKGYKYKRIYTSANLTLTTLESVSTSDGKAFYLNKSDKCEYRGMEGPVAFSRHAFERLFERCPEFDKFSYRQPASILAFLYSVITARKFMEGAGTMLSAYPWGFFPTKFASGFWICTSFLTPGMDGTPKSKTAFSPRWETLPKE